MRILSHKYMPIYHISSVCLEDLLYKILGHWLFTKLWTWKWHCLTQAKMLPIISNIQCPMCETSLIELDFIDVSHSGVAAKSLQPKWNILTNCRKGMYRFRESLSACRDYWNERIIMGYKLLEALRQNAQTDGKWCARERNIGKFPLRAQKFLSKSQQSGLSVLIWLCQLVLLYYIVRRGLSLFIFVPWVHHAGVLWVGS